MICDASPFYAQVPKLPDQNLIWRRELLRRAAGDRGLQRDLLYASKVDLLFWVNSFGWLFEPRVPPPGRKLFPFVSYPFQDAALLRLQAVLGIENVVIEKSRDLGGTWMVLYLFVHEFLFGESEDFGVVSRDMDAVDKTGNKGTLFWKIRFILGKEREGFGLPTWMRPPILSNNGVVVNEANGSAIVGYPATSDELRGDRKRAVLFDEFSAFPTGKDHSAKASANFVTNCLIMMGTPDPERGASGAFYDEAMKSRRLGDLAV